MVIQQEGAAVAQEALCAVTELLDNLCGGLLVRHQSYRLACIDIGKIVILTGDGLCELLTRFTGLLEFIDVSVPLIGKAIV